MTLPNPNQSRTESYLGVIVEQEGAIKPLHPQTRVEEYLEYIIEQGVPSGRAGSKVRLSVDPLSYLMTLQLLNKDDEVISTTSVDLPLEEMIVGGRYDSANKTLILTLKNGEVINIPIGDIISGLVEEAPKDNKYYARINGNWVEIIPFTQAEKTKLSGIEAGAQVNDPNTVIDANYVHTDNNYTIEEKNKLSGIEAGAEVNDPNTVIDANYVHTDNNYTTEEKQKLSGLENYDDTDIRSGLTTLGQAIVEESQRAIQAENSKQPIINDLETIREGAAAGSTAVQPEAGKGLSSNDYTTAEKNKLSGIEAGAQVNDPNTVVDANYVHTDNNYTGLEKTKLEGIEEGAEANDPNTVIDANYVHTDNNYTTEEKTKLAGLENYDDTNVVKYIQQAKTDSEKEIARRNINAASLDTFVRNALIGGVTKEQYNDLMKEWFVANGCAVMIDLTSLVERWYTITRIGWNGGTKFNQPDKSSVSTGIAIGDNVGLSCTPSTNSVANTDNYASLPLFTIKDANVTLDTDGEPHVTAIEGIPGANAFDRYDTTKVVEVLQMTPWMKYSEDENYYTWEYTDEIGKTGYIPWPSAVSLKDNHVRAFVHHVKYVFGDNWTSCSGRKVRTGNISHNAQITGVRGVWGNKYGGKSCSDDAWVKHMTYIKYKSLTLDGIMNGCLSYYIHNLHPAVAEENVERIIMEASSVSSVIVGSSVSLSSADMATTGSIVDRVVITSIEDVTIEGVTYKAINVDNGGVKFNTTLESIFYTWHWRTGSTDDVLGNDGSPYSNTSTKEPYKIQGIEQIVGCWEVMGDTILTYKNNKQIPAVCRDATKLATSITSDYIECSYGYDQPDSSAYVYVKKLGFDPNLPELLYSELGGGSSSTFTKDAHYIEAKGTTGLREWLAFGYLSNGLAYGGLSCLNGLDWLSAAFWSFGGRLSSNINRGEFERSAA